jgi:hypothetical protein
MDNIKSQFSYMATTPEGPKRKTVDVELSDYQAAANTNMSFKQLINSRCSDADPAYGNAFNQAVQAMGCYNRVHGQAQGLISPTLKQVFTGMEAGAAVGNVQMGTITAPDGSDHTPAGRIFYPEIVMDMMRDSLLRDNSDIEEAFNSMIAITDNVAGSLYTQPQINVTGNEGVSSQPIAQGADPATMINITTSQVSRAIPTRSIGLQITDQAANFATVDLVATAIQAQSRGERIRMVDSDIAAVINGDTDAGFGALTGVTLKSYDSANILAAGVATHKAFLKMLHADYQKLSIDSAIMDIDTYLAFEERIGRPTQDKDMATDNRLNMKFRPINFSLQDLNILIVDKTVVGANTALFLDSRFALRKVVDVTAQYEAVQAFVMRRMSQMRFDYGQHVTFSKMLYA